MSLVSDQETSLREFAAGGEVNEVAETADGRVSEVYRLRRTDDEFATGEQDETRVDRVRLGDSSPPAINTPIATGAKPGPRRIHLFRTKYDTVGAVVEKIGADIRKLLTEAGPFSSKEDCPLFSPGIFDGPIKDRVPIEFWMVVAEHDEGSVSVDEARQRLEKAGLAAFIATTANHLVNDGQKYFGKPRWRVVAPLKSPIVREDYPKHLGVLNAAMGGCLAPESANLNRRWFYGRVDGVEYRVETVHSERALDDLVREGKIEPIPVKPTETNTGEHPERYVRTEVIELTEKQIGDLRSALFHRDENSGLALDPDNRETWIKVIQNLKRHGEPGRELARDWSKFSGKHADDEFDKKFDEPGGNRSDYRSIFTAAAARGWVNPGTRNEPNVYGFENLSGGEADAADKPLKFPPMTVAEFRGLAPAAWAVKNVLPKQGLACVYGASGSGKTFFVLDVAMHIARGLWWRGHRVTKGVVLYVAGEGVAGVRTRVEAYLREHGLTKADLFVVRGTPNFHANRLDHTEIIRSARTVGATVVVIDTLAATSAGADENGGKDMNPVLERLQAVAAAIEGLVLIVHHSGKDTARGARGWSGIRAALDTEIEVTVDLQSRVHTAEVSKQRDGETGERFGFTLKQVALEQDEDGDAITSCLVEPAATPERSAKRVKVASERKPRGQYQQVAYDLVSGTGAIVPYDDVVATVMSKMPPPEGDKRDARRTNARREVNALIKGGFIEMAGNEHVRLRGLGEDF